MLAILLPASKDRRLALHAASESRLSSENCWSAWCSVPAPFNLLHLHLFEGGQATGALLLLAQVGAMVLMFIAGIETDIDRMREASVTAFVVALSGVIWPFLSGRRRRASVRAFLDRPHASWAAR